MKALFIGNGINQVSDAGASWRALLDKLAGKARTKHEEDIRRAKPFTLWFEEISSKGDKKNLKQKVADGLRSTLVPNSVHEQVMDMGFSDILTTNYDYTLEEASRTTWNRNNASRETYYSLFRRRSSGSQNIWYIHGEMGNVGSIMLGHEQYSGYINKIRNFLTAGVETDLKARDKKPYVSKFSEKKTRRKGDVENWVDIFLEREVHIVGFGLDYTENHLWNLIMEKRRLRKKSGRSIGGIYFHRCSDQEQTIADQARLSILRSLGVEVLDHTDSTYLAAYERCLSGLSKHLCELNAFLEGLTEISSDVASPPSLHEIIAEGESDQLEFKSTFRWELASGSVSKKLPNVIVKTVAAFGNAEGGTLLIGVGDDGSIIGLDNDYASIKGDKDKFELMLCNALVNALGQTFVARKVSITFPSVDGVEICQVETSPANEPLVIDVTDAKGRKQEKFYVRSGNSSQEVPLSQMREYFDDRFN